jgi:hypothetical protein
VFSDKTAHVAAFDLFGVRVFTTLAHRALGFGGRICPAQGGKEDADANGHPREQGGDGTVFKGKEYAHNI